MSTPVDVGAARRKVLGPAIGILVVGILGALVSLLAAVVGLIGQERSGGLAGADMVAEQVGKALAVVIVFVWSLMGLVAAIGGVRMMGLNNYGFSFAACILSMIPCYNSCCILGLPFGIWGLIMLLQSDVKEVFKMRAKMKAEGRL